jgi:hypothetical protein
MIIIPCGIDCGLADLLQKYNLRHSSLPFDWSVSYGGISKIIKNDFHDFIPTNKNNNKINTIYNYSFLHNEFPQDTEKMIRRCNRLLDILKNNTDEIIFIRKGHAFHHHNECAINNLQLINDIVDAENLSSVLKEKYPNLRYKIITVLVCDTCFDKNTNFISNDTNVKIYNISTPTHDIEKFEAVFKNIFLNNS